MNPNQFLPAIAATYALVLWWIFALFVHVNIGHNDHHPGGQSQAAWFNVVLLIVVASVWVLCGVFAHNKGKKF